MMQKKRIQCPRCGVVLEVKNSKNEEVKQISCPQCHCDLQVKFAPQQESIEAPTYYAPKSSAVDNGATQLAGSSYGATQLATSVPKAGKSAKLMCDGISYELSEGQNIVGRKGTTSKATIQIVTEDRYMSRQHSVINVTTLPDGTIKAVLSNYQNKNLTTIDGQDIEEGDQIRLSDGNQITMGHTTITYKIS